MRPSQRSFDQLREITLEPEISPYAEGSCLIKCGNTHVLCTATVETQVPRFLRNTGSGWVTAEYSMLPRSTHSRMQREAARGKQGGRTLEIQRLIGRALRQAVDLNALGERQIIIDCDVIQADGGTRTASITGGYVALALAIKHLQKTKELRVNPLKSPVAAISCGIVKGEVVVDVDYAEDSTADVDANFVMNAEGKLLEIQATAEEDPFDVEAFNKMLVLAQGAISTICEKQLVAIGDASEQAA